MSDRTYYVICDDNCRFEGMTKEQVYDAIAEATGSTPTPVDTAFITQIKEQNAQASLKVWKGTEAQFNALASKSANTIYIIGTDEIRNYDAALANHNHDDRYYTETEMDHEEVAWKTISDWYTVTCSSNKSRYYDVLDKYDLQMHVVVNIPAGETISAGTRFYVGHLQLNDTDITLTHRQAVNVVSLANGTSATSTRMYQGFVDVDGYITIMCNSDLAGGSDGSRFNVGVSGALLV